MEQSDLSQEEINSEEYWVKFSFFLLGLVIILLLILGYYKYILKQDSTPFYFYTLTIFVLFSLKAYMGVKTRESWIAQNYQIKTVIREKGPWNIAWIVVDTLIALAALAITIYWFI
ncbi:MAG: hypothetical protein UT11_C0008G0006 [Berkelbacteria bacterium GW2011_GWA2_38_9]|uniref:Uncharacterized protein n=1 Tax=Berkelbacteria bacterium GW2011_GWA2_38_9 TaxID=1618334 RepID=A0A0G0LEL5_9BACT|nr:MAG: hypothetical protein UT11_C0008G0006 [Berkelbacteria bacterium GW2011_GWA2_38_9]